MLREMALRILGMKQSRWQLGSYKSVNVCFSEWCSQRNTEQSPELCSSHMTCPFNCTILNGDDKSPMPFLTKRKKEGRSLTVERGYLSRAIDIYCQATRMII